MMTRRLRRVWILAIIGLLSGCATSGLPVLAPEVSLSSVEATSMSFDEQTFELGFDVHNPNPFPLPIRAVRYTVRLNEQNFAGGQTQGAMTIPADGYGSFIISVNLDVMRTGVQLASLLKGGVRDNLNYELHGKFDLDLPSNPQLGFTSNGTIAVQTASR